MASAVVEISWCRRYEAQAVGLRVAIELHGAAAMRSATAAHCRGFDGHVAGSEFPCWTTRAFLTRLIVRWWNAMCLADAGAVDVTSTWNAGSDVDTD